LTTLPDNCFDHLVDLRHLSLNDNELLTLPEGVFRHLENLTEFTIEGNTLLDDKLNSYRFGKDGNFVLEFVHQAEPVWDLSAQMISRSMGLVDTVIGWAKRYAVLVLFHSEVEDGDLKTIESSLEARHTKALEARDQKSVFPPCLFAYRSRRDQEWQIGRWYDRVYFARYLISLYCIQRFDPYLLRIDPPTVMEIRRALGDDVVKETIPECVTSNHAIEERPDELHRHFDIALMSEYNLRKMEHIRRLEAEFVALEDENRTLMAELHALRAKKALEAEQKA